MSPFTAIINALNVGHWLHNADTADLEEVYQPGAIAIRDGLIAEIQHVCLSHDYQEEQRGIMRVYVVGTYYDGSPFADYWLPGDFEVVS